MSALSLPLLLFTMNLHVCLPHGRRDQMVREELFAQKRRFLTFKVNVPSGDQRLDASGSLRVHAKCCMHVVPSCQRLHAVHDRCACRCLVA